MTTACLAALAIWAILLPLQVRSLQTGAVSLPVACNPHAFCTQPLGFSKSILPDNLPSICALSPSWKGQFSTRGFELGDEKAQAVAIKGSKVVMGWMASSGTEGRAIVSDLTLGAIYGGRQVELETTNPLDRTDSHFGVAVAIDDGHIVVGGGGLWVFGSDGQPITGRIMNGDSTFGFAVAIDEGRIVTSAFRISRVCVYKICCGKVELESMFSSARGTGFGLALAITGRDIVVGAPFTNIYEGRAYIHSWTPFLGRWPRRTVIKAEDGQFFRQFGRSVAIDQGGRVVVGSLTYPFGSGRVYVL